MNKQPLGALCEFSFKTGIKVRQICIPIFVGMIAAAHSSAQQPCAQGIRIDGIVIDPTGAVISGASMHTSSGATVLTDATGHYGFACEAGTSTMITADAAGFAKAMGRAHARAGGVTHVNLKLSVASVETSVEVNANAGGVDSGDSAGSIVLGPEAIERLSDDPDDLLRELQTMAAGGGGAPGGAIISVDGFQNGSPLPPKGSIAEIRINPDPFSAQYATSNQEPSIAGRSPVLETCASLSQRPTLDTIPPSFPTGQFARRNLARSLQSRLFNNQNR